MGFANAEYELGKMLLEGTSGPADLDEGRKWLEKAAKQGQKDAASLLEALNAKTEVAPDDPPVAD